MHIHSASIAKRLVCSVFASTPFKFLVGSEKRLFTLHSTLVSHQSKPLCVHISGKMSEAKEGCVLLDDIDEDTFIRFSQHTYTGDYTTAEPVVLLDASTIATTHRDSPERLVERAKDHDGETSVGAIPEPEPDYQDTGGYCSKRKKDKKKGKGGIPWDWSEKQNMLCECGASQIPDPLVLQSKREKLWDSFKCIAYPAKPTFKARKNREACECYTDVFLCHARLYAFAERYEIVPLKALSLHKLHHNLVEFVVYDERVEDILDLIRYSYANTADLSDSIDGLRLLVVHYAACVIEDLAKHSGFRLLLEESGPFARDLVDQLLRRLD